MKNVRRRVLNTTFMAGIITASASMGLQGCDSINQYVPGGSDMLTSALGMDLSFKVSGAPADDVEAAYFYLMRTKTMLGTLDKQGQGLAGEFARTFDIQVNTATDAGMAELAEEAAKIDPESMSDNQKQWLEKNLPMLVAWVYAAVSVGDSGWSLATAATNAFEQDPVGIGKKAYDAWPDVKASLEKVEPVFTSGKAVVENAIRLAKATGVTPPTPEEERANASKLASQGLPAGEEAEFS